MKQHHNLPEIAEVGLFTLAYQFLLALGTPVTGMFAPYQANIEPVLKELPEYITNLNVSINRITMGSSRIQKIIWVGFEGIFMDDLVLNSSFTGKHYLIGSHKSINKQRVLMNFGYATNITFCEPEAIGQLVTGDTIIVIPYFRLANGETWTYSFSSATLTSAIARKARKVIGVCMIDNLVIEPDEDHVHGALQLLHRFDANVMQEILFINPNDDCHEHNINTHLN